MLKKASRLPSRFLDSSAMPIHLQQICAALQTFMDVRAVTITNVRRHAHLSNRSAWNNTISSSSEQQLEEADEEEEVEEEAAVTTVADDECTR